MNIQTFDPIYDFFFEAWKKFSLFSDSSCRVKINKERRNLHFLHNKKKILHIYKFDYILFHLRNKIYFFRVEWKKIFMSTNEGKISVWKAAIPERENIFTIFHHISVQVEKNCATPKHFYFFISIQKLLILMLLTCVYGWIRLKIANIKKITKKWNLHFSSLFRCCVAFWCSFKIQRTNNVKRKFSWKKKENGNEWKKISQPL